MVSPPDSCHPSWLARYPPFMAAGGRPAEVDRHRQLCDPHFTAYVQRSGGSAEPTYAASSRECLAFARDCAQYNRAGQVVLQLKTARHDGTNHLVMSPREFTPRLVALVLHAAL